MPTIIARLTVLFKADSSDQEAIDHAFDQALLVRPPCKIVHNHVVKIDGVPVNQEELIRDVFKSRILCAPGVKSLSDIGDDDISDDEDLPSPRELMDTTSWALKDISYSHRIDISRPDSSGTRPFQSIDSYRPRPSDGPSFQPIDSYRPKEYGSSDFAGLHSERNKRIHSPELVDYRTGHHSENFRSVGVSGVSTRYDALIDSTPEPQFLRIKKNNGQRHVIDHYSPPRRNRSASPSSSGLRRSDRLHLAESSKEITWPPERKLSLPESHEHGRRSRGLKQHRKEDKLVTESASLETLAAKTVAKDVAAGRRSRFRKQQEKHGITEALRLKNLRFNQKVEKARVEFGKQRWGEGEVREGAKMDAVIDEITSLGLDTVKNGNDVEQQTGQPPVQTRKRRKGRGGKVREGSSGPGASSHKDEETKTDLDMQEVDV